MKEKEIKKQVKLLAKQKKFEQIYLEYGPKYFRKYVSRKYKREDIAKLEEEEKFLDIYMKYGEDYWEEIWTIDAEQELGRKMTRKEKWSNKNFIVQSIKRAIIMIELAYVGTVLLLNSPPGQEEIQEAKNAKKYAKEIDKYEKAVKEYAKKFDIHSQSDMEIIMRTMKDMHDTIQGYGQPKLDIEGYQGIDVMYEGGVGVCRNMANNIADKLNAINPDYNARIVTLYDALGEIEKANIKNNLLKEDNKRIEKEKNIEKVFIDEELREEIITEEDKTIIYGYDEGKISRKTISTEKQTKELLYDQNGDIAKETITFIEKQEDNEKHTIYTNGKLTRKTELTKDYYNAIAYEQNGEIEEEIRADKEGEVKNFYKKGKLRKKVITKKEKETTIFYDENEKEESRKTEEIAKTLNIFELLQTGKLTPEQLRKKAREEQKEIIINHAIVAIDIQKDKLTLLIDPTNPSIGIYKDGKIKMFNETKPEEAINDRSFVGDMWNKGFDGIIDYPIDYIKSFIEPTLSLEELEEKYG